jgi:phospholipase/lecithinase/hemolysin
MGIFSPSLEQKVMDSSATMSVLAVLLLVLAVAQPSGADTPCYTRLFSFGDSLTDTGNFRFVFPNDTLAPGLSFPYGETFFNHPTGRCSNGRLIVDFIGTPQSPVSHDPRNDQLTVAAGVLILKSMWVYVPQRPR